MSRSLRAAQPDERDDQRDHRQRDRHVGTVPVRVDPVLRGVALAVVPQEQPGPEALQQDGERGQADQHAVDRVLGTDGRPRRFCGTGRHDILRIARRRLIVCRSSAWFPAWRRPIRCAARATQRPRSGRCGLASRSCRGQRERRPSPTRPVRGTARSTGSRTGSSPAPSGTTRRPRSTTRTRTRAWSTGNTVRPLVHGATYFAELFAAIERTRDGDLIMFTDWRGDPDERLTRRPGQRGRPGAVPRPPGAGCACTAWSGARTWTGSSSPRRRTGTSARRSTRPAGAACSTCGCVRAARTTRSSSCCATPAGRSSTSPSSAASTCATAGATTPSTAATRSASRWPPCTATGRRGTTCSSRSRGPAVGDVETVFRERWDDPQPLSRNPVHRLADCVRHDDAARSRCPRRCPSRAVTGTLSVQLLRTYPRRVGGLPVRAATASAAWPAATARRCRGRGG